MPHPVEFKALRVSSLTEEVAKNLETRLSGLSGIEQYTIRLETQEVTIKFDDQQLSFRSLVQAMTEAGCSLQDINAALLLQAKKKL